MKKDQLIDRFKLAAKKYVENDAWTSSALTFLTGQEPGELQIFSTSKTTDVAEIFSFNDELKSIINSIEDDYLKKKANRNSKVFRKLYIQENYDHFLRPILRWQRYGIESFEITFPA